MSEVRGKVEQSTRRTTTGVMVMNSWNTVQQGNKRATGSPTDLEKER